jgi:hypothetical protein
MLKAIRHFFKESSMKKMFLLFLVLFSLPAFANTWYYQVNINNQPGKMKQIDSGKNSLEAGPYYCETTPITVQNNTEYRTLTCSVGAGTVSTGALCTQKKAKVASVQYAILTLTGPKNSVNVVVSCRFD